jgi:hypothetical protein
MGRGKGPKDPYADLDQAFKDRVNAAKSGEELKAILSEATLGYTELMAAKDLDEDLKSKKEAAKEAGAIYREGTKRYKLKTKFIRQTLASRGLPTDR